VRVRTCTPPLLLRPRVRRSRGSVIRHRAPVESGRPDHARRGTTQPPDWPPSRPYSRSLAEPRECSRRHLARSSSSACLRSNSRSACDPTSREQSAWYPHFRDALSVRSSRQRMQCSNSQRPAGRTTMYWPCQVCGAPRLIASSCRSARQERRLLPLLARQDSPPVTPHAGHSTASAAARVV
jgi:hypothetical protein